MWYSVTDSITRTENKLKYSELVDILKDRNSISKHRANTLAKEYSECLKNKLTQGYDLEILSIFSVVYVGKSTQIEENKVYGFNEQVQDVATNLNWDVVEVKMLLLDYLKLMKHKLEQGYQINLKSIGYIVPFKDEEGNSGYIERFSPVLELAENLTVVTLDDNGNFGIKKLTNEDFYIRMECSDKLDSPIFSKKSKDFKFKTIDL